MTASVTCPVVEVDPFDERELPHPYTFHEQLREAGPVAYLPKYGLYAMGRYEHVREAFANQESFVSGRGVGIDDFAEQESWRKPSLLLETDPPEHGQFRKIMASVVNAGSVRGLREEFAREADAIVDELLEREAVDAIADIAERFLLSVFPRAVGIRPGGEKHLLAYGTAVFNTIGPRNRLYAEAISSIPPVADWIEESCSRELLNPGGFGAAIWQSVDSGELDPELAPLLVRSLLSAGIDSTIVALGNLIFALARHPEQWAVLRDDPRRIRFAFDEALRWDSAVQMFFRTTKTDVRVGDVVIPQNTKVLLSIGAANRDPRKWGDTASEFDVKRTAGGHLGFGMGIHQCVGQPLARLEAEVLLTALAGKVERLELVGEPQPKLNNVLKGWGRVPLRLSAS